MIVGLYNLEGDVFNSALMQVSQYHKNRGDDVYLYNPLFDYDKVYAFSLFDFTPKSYVTDDMICGGTGFDVSSKLPIEIECCDLDYSIQPDCDFSMLWFSRGCVRNCPFCIVREKEGYIKPVVPKNLNPRGKYIKVMDNNFFANPEWKSAINYLICLNQPVDFQGVDIRNITEEQCYYLSKLNHYKAIKVAWDNPNDDIIDNLKLLLKYVPKHKIFVYIIVGFWSCFEEDMFRINFLKELGVEPYIMPFDKSDVYQRNLVRWVNRKQLFHSCSFKEFCYSKPNGVELYDGFCNVDYRV